MNKYTFVHVHITLYIYLYMYVYNLGWLQEAIKAMPSLRSTATEGGGGVETKPPKSNLLNQARGLAIASFN